MVNHISIKGFVSSDIESRTLDTGVFVSNFRMGSTESKRDPVTSQWVDGHTNWFHVSSFRALAVNTAMSIHKGDRIMVTGKLKVSTYLRKDGTQGTNVDIEADSIGHDLKFGVVTFHKVANGRPQENTASATGGAGSEATTTAGPDGGSLDAPGQSWPPAETEGEGGHGPNGAGPDANVDMADEQEGAQLAAQAAADDDVLDQDEEVDEATGEIVAAGAPF